MVDMAKGLPASIIKKYGVTKKAWAVFRGRRHTRRSHAITTRARRVVSMARRRYRRRSYRRIRSRFHKPKSYPLAVLFPLAGGLVAPIQQAMGGDWQGALDNASVAYSGYSFSSGSWTFPEATKNILIGFLIHKAASMVGINRQLAKLPSPLNKIAL